MGFFKDIFAIAAPVLGQVVSGTAIGGALALPGVTAGVSAVANIQKGVALQKATQAAVATPTGGLRRRTIVETFDPATNVVTKQETFKGAPAVMMSDVAAANRVNRQVRKLEKRLPKKMVQESATARLKREVLDAGLRAARDHAGGHHGNGHDNPLVIRA